MYKTEIEVPEGIKYLNEFENFELPNGILNKQVPGCGATTLALEDKHKTIICSPRNNLIINKNEQYPQTLLVIGKIQKCKILDYLKTEQTPKILCSYDSLKKVTSCIEDKKEWRVVVDEFQYLLFDSSFKSETELRFLDCVKEFEYVTYLSATPLLDEFIENIEALKDATYYELKWKQLATIKLFKYQASKPINYVLEIIKYYKNGHSLNLNLESKGIAESKECVIYLNSVTNILNIIHQSHLKPEEVNIIVGDNEDNRNSLKKLGEGFSIGKIPLKGEAHKMFTFCTSTAFAGCDFYSTNATTFVVSDASKRHTAIDIATDLLQIAGRQRLAENPFRNMIFFIYNTFNGSQKEEEYQQILEKKKTVTLEDIELKNNCSPELKEKYIREVSKFQKMMNYEESYTMYDPTSGNFVFNKMAYLSDKFSYLLQSNYSNEIQVMDQCDKAGFDNKEELVHLYEYNEQIKYLICSESFEERMKHYCEYLERQEQSKGFILNLSIDPMLHAYPKIKIYFEELGAKRIKALGYKEAALKREILFKNNIAKAGETIKSHLNVNDRYTTTNLKKMIAEVYSSLGLEKKAKAKDLSSIYGIEMKSCKINDQDGKRTNGWIILSF